MVLRGQPFPFPALRLIPGELSACDAASSFLQSGFWGGFKARFGWTAYPFLADWGEGEEGRRASLLVLWRPLAPALSFAYVPGGPELPEELEAVAPQGGGGEALRLLARALRPFLPRDTAFIRFDPPWYTEGPETPPPRLPPPFTRAAADVQPPDTVLVDLKAPEEEILRGMKPKTRYNIGLAARKGVTVERRDEAGLEVFYALYRETAKRDGIAIHGAEYYRALFDCGKLAKQAQIATQAQIAKQAQIAGQDGEGAGGEVRLYLAFYQGEAIAGIITLFRPPRAVYLYGASSNHQRNLMAPYALQWRAMRDAREARCAEYDLYGIPPREDPSHPMAGLYRFKTGFGGRIIHRSGSWDYTCLFLRKNLFSAAESLRKFLWSMKKR
ncbi:MAG: peptidoglycan bridge formation glycyltransferase FemA/FemB family protein [Spirochaetaceae bacterium]|jgi:lipid II:glycine glycyltransferase (peptidoglycan interpeptide bridge formation enzyme)|nr:peptidoglycan bridge formation glycyltransferase FemA/FemB family protein [Spirochaetaceae bacterium]